MWGNLIKLPSHFVFKEEHLKSTISVLVDFSKLKQKKLRLDFSQVTNIGKGDIMVLMAQLEKTIINKKKEIEVKGKFPRIVKNLLSEKVLHFTEETLNNYNAADKIKTVDPSIVSSVASEMQKIGISRNTSYGSTYYERIEALINEIVGNAIEHGIREKNINCWLTTEKVNNTIKVTFVDMGLGIAKSHKKAKLPLNYKIIGIFGDNKIISDSLYGKLPSSTQKPGRGRGLPEIRNIVEQEWVSNFILVSNRTSMQFRDSRFKSIKVKDFKGTYYSWTISKYNFEIWKKWKNIK